MNAECLIPVNGLSAGKHGFSWRIGKEFFVGFDNSDVLDADVSIEVMVEKSGTYVGIDCQLDGYVTVLCDRCLEDLRLPIVKTVRLSVKFGAEPADSAAQDLTDDGREIVYLSDEESSMDMSQTIYDYCMLSLPLKRVHPEGQCNPDAVRFLCSELKSSEPEETTQGDDDNPFAALKGLFEKE